MKNRLEAIISGLIAQGVPAFGEVHVLAASNTSAVGGYMRDWTDPDKWHNSLITAEARLTSARNDVLLLTPESHSIATALTWDGNMTHLCGMYSPSLMNHRTRVGHSANFATMITVSGYGNTFANLYMMHGRGSATNATGLSVTGSRNTFLNCHFGGPFHTTEAGTAAYRLVSVTGSENYFKNCVFGQDTVSLGAAIGLLVLGGASTHSTTVFDNCIFMCMNNASAGAGAVFVQTIADTIAGLALFRNCTFINIGSTALTLGITGAGLNAGYKIHSDNSTWVGCTDVIAAANEAAITFQAATYTAGITANGLAAAYDHTP